MAGNTISSARFAGAGGWRFHVYLGGHFGTDSPLFLRKYVVPLLRVERRPGP